MAKKKSKVEKLSQLLNETQPKVHLNITDDEREKLLGEIMNADESAGMYDISKEENHPVSGSLIKSWTDGNGNTIESLGTRLNGMTAYKTVVNGVERVVDLKNMDDAIEFVNLLLDIGDDGK